MRRKSRDAWIFPLSLLVGFLAVFVLVGFARSRGQAARISIDDGSEPGMKVGERATPPPLRSVSGEVIDPLGGPPGFKVLCFTSRRCPKCSDEAPVWRALTARGGARTFVVSLDSGPEEVRRYAEAYELGGLPVLYGEERNSVLQAFRIRIMPQYLVFDPQGRVVYRDAGYLSATRRSATERAEAILAAVAPRKGAS